MKKKLFCAMIALMPMVAWSADGDVFKAKTVENVEMEFKVISESEKTCQVGYGEDGNFIHQCINGAYEGVVTIPETANGYKVTTVAKWAFFGCKLTKLTIPDGVTFIGKQAFAFTDNLTSINIPASMTVIPEWAYSGISGLTSITIPTSVTTIESCAFDGCKSLQPLTIPASVTSIGSRVFGDCDNLTSVTFEGTVKESGSVFYACPNLKEVHFGENVTEIVTNLLSGCDAMTSLTIPAHIKKLGKYCIRSKSLESITIEGDLDEMGETTVYSTYTERVSWIGDCPKLTTIIFADGVTKIADEALAHCKTITTVSIAKSVNTIGAYAFEFMENLTNFSTSAETIGKGAFLGCTNLQHIGLLEGVKYIGDEAFKQTGLKSVSFPASLKTIGNQAFVAPVSSESILETISFSDPDESLIIGKGAFMGNTKLSSVVIPDNVFLIDFAFYGCGLKAVTSLSMHPSAIGYSVFAGQENDENSYLTATLYVPVGTKELYKKTDFWSSFNIIIEGTPTSIGQTLKSEDSRTVYSITGRKNEQLQRGLNIVRLADGTTRKVMVK